MTAIDLGRAIYRLRLAFRMGTVSSALLFLSSCAGISHIPTSREAAGSTGAGVALQAPDRVFDYRPSPISYENHFLEESARYETRRISFPSIGDNGQIDNLVTVDYHRSRLPGPHPVVIVLPIWGRQVYPSNAVTRTLRKRSNGRVHVLNVLGADFLIDWPKLGVVTDENEFFDTWVEGAEREIATLIDMKRLIDWAEDHAEIDSGRVGLIGFSHGAMFAPALTAQEPRISATVLVMGGADPHEIIARCVGARTEDVQLHAQETFGWSKEEMAANLEPIYGSINATRYTGRFDSTRVLIFDSGKDECVPKSARDALWEAMGRPERYTINADHRHAFYSMTPLRLNWMRKKIWNFFEERLLPPEVD